jgi:hypothetical protein
MNRRFPETKGRDVVIDVVGKYPLSGGATTFYHKAESIVQGAGFSLQYRHLTEY